MVVGGRRDVERWFSVTGNSWQQGTESGKDWYLKCWETLDRFRSIMLGSAEEEVVYVFDTRQWNLVIRITAA